MRQKNLDKQKQILDFVNRQVQEKGYPPSVREICKAVVSSQLPPFIRTWQPLRKKG